MPEIRSIQTTSHSAIAATKMYLIHWPMVFGSVRFSATGSQFFSSAMI
jgi:hypothetical protein